MEAGEEGWDWEAEEEEESEAAAEDSEGWEEEAKRGADRDREESLAVSEGVQDWESWEGARAKDAPGGMEERVEEEGETGMAAGEAGVQAVATEGAEMVAEEEDTDCSEDSEAEEDREAARGEREATVEEGPRGAGVEMEELRVVSAPREAAAKDLEGEEAEAQEMANG